MRLLLRRLWHSIRGCPSEDWVSTPLWTVCVSCQRACFVTASGALSQASGDVALRILEMAVDWPEEGAGDAG